MDYHDATQNMQTSQDTGFQDLGYQDGGGKKPHNILGIISCASAVVMFILWAVLLVSLAFMGDANISEDDPIAIIIGFAVLGFLFLNVVGAVMGLISLFLQGSKIWGILGMLVHGLELISFVVLVVIGLLMAP